MYQSEATQSALEMGAAGEFEYEFESPSGEFESPLNEQQEVELAQELLEITNEAELEQFLGSLIKGVGNAVGGIIKSPIGRALGGVLKNVAKTALPMVGGALGSFVAPGIGTALGSKLGSMASNLFEVELEGLPQEQQEMEVARRLVRLTAGAASQAALAPPGASTRLVVERSIAGSARRHAPGLLRGVPVMPLGGITADYGDDGGGYASGGYDRSAGSVGGRPRSGRWVRRGRQYVLLNT
jgi:uncharacterized protein (DUF697 family)